MPTTDRLERNPPASELELSAFSSRVPFELPPDYIQFLRESDGAEGAYGSSYLVIWPIDQIFKLNEDYHISEFAPHLFLFGSDGGGEAYAFDTRTSPVTIVGVPFVGFDDATVLGHNFTDFLSRIAVA